MFLVPGSFEKFADFELGFCGFSINKRPESMAKTRERREQGVESRA